MCEIETGIFSGQSRCESSQAATDLHGQRQRQQVLVSVKCTDSGSSTRRERSEMEAEELHSVRHALHLLDGGGGGGWTQSHQLLVDKIHRVQTEKQTVQSKTEILELENSELKLIIANIMSAR